MANDWTETAKVVIEAAKVVVAVLGGVWAYWLFFKQRTIAPRIEFDLSCRFLGPQQNAYLAEYTLALSNKGLVRQRVKKIRLTVRGIKKNDHLAARKDRPNALNFPHVILDVFNMIPEQVEYIFVEPGVDQNVRHSFYVNDDFSFIRVSGEFLYESGIEHSAAQVFEVRPSKPEKAE